MVSADPAGGGSRGAKCPRCGRVGTLAGKRVRPWFTLFFLPLFPMGAGRAITQCKGCGATFAASVRELGRAVERADGRQAQRAISLYNSLRASPANSVTLNELMGLHLSLGEPEQAVNAAADFVDALNASEQCMTTLGRAYGVAGKTDDAIHWFDAALARNPNFGEAHYLRAAAQMNRIPPDLAQAVASARAARKSEHPGAAELLATAEARVHGDGA